MTRSLVASVLVAALAVGTVPAYAQTDDKPDFAAAKVHYDSAEKAMTDGRYEDAASEYGVAYDITKDPVLFLKIGNAELKAGKCDAAVVYFKRYLKEGNPSDDYKTATEDKIAACEGGGGATTTTTDTGTGTTTTDTGTGTTTDTGTGTTTDTGTDTGTETGTGGAPSFLDNGSSWKRSAGWISLGASVAFATAGGILAMSGKSREEDLNSLTDFRDPQDLPASYDGNVRDRYEQLVTEGKRFNTMSEVAFGVAGVAAVSAAVLLLLDAKSHHGESASAITILAAPHSGGVAASLKF